MLSERLWDRDHNGWWWVMGGAIVAALLSDLSVVNDIAPDGWEKTIHAVIKLASIVTAAGAGVARMSPQGMSAAGRVKINKKKSQQLDKASKAAIVASTKADVAVAATTEAAEAADVAKDISKDAGDL